MKKIFIILIVICFPIIVFAEDMNIKIIEAENEIRKSATINTEYNSEIVLDNELLDEAVYSASEKKKEYNGLEAYKRPETNILINISGKTKNTIINISNDIKDYSSIADNIIMNINGMYCYIMPSELDNDFENIKLTINDKQNIIAKYNGTAYISTIKKAAALMVAAAVIYILIFMLFIVRNKSFKEGYRIKRIYILCAAVSAIGILYCGVLFFTDLSSLAEKKEVTVSDSNNPVFDVSFDGCDDLSGVYLGLPLYADGFNPKYTAVWIESDDSSESDKIIGGNYNDIFETIKFPVIKSGNYYMKNNKKSFEDVTESNKELYEAVTVLAAKNIIDGKTDGIYGINDTVTRGEAITMFSRLLYFENSIDDASGFDDVSSVDWYYDYISQGKKNNILSGYDDNTFRAENEMTRQEFVGIIGQIMENKMGYAVSEDYSNLSAYTDNGEIALWAKKYISLLERENMNIWEEEYEPQKSVTRSEVAVLLYRCYINMK